jgi:hypothetical protein
MSLKKIQESGNWNPFPIVKHQKLMSTVGTAGPKCFHNMCDWCIGVRWHNGNHCWGDPLKLPKIIFVACYCFLFFYNNIYPHIPNDHKYILIIADEDTTIPRQTDKRWSEDAILTNAHWENIVNNKNIIHIFASHLDIPKTDRYSPLPVGFNPEEHINLDIDTLLLQEVDTNIMSRPLIIKGCSRIRDGPQWEVRRIVKELATTSWSSFSNWEDIPVHDFFMEIQKYSFLFCPHGGGLEPNPKVFSAIYCCTIPIIKRFVNCEILYENLPVVFIDEWEKDNITLEKLHIWRENLKPYFSGDKREKVLEKLTSDYWMKYILDISNLQS